MQTIIFLDCDGCINSKQWYISDLAQSLEFKCNPKNDPDIDPNVIQRINKLCELTGAKIVVSSSWRIDPYYKIRLENAGLKNIIGCTPEFDFKNVLNYSRGIEIQEWLDNHDEVNYIIIDDELDFTEEQQKHFIHTDYNLGFTKDDFNRAYELINKTSR